MEWNWNGKYDTHTDTDTELELVTSPGRPQARNGSAGQGAARPWALPFL